MKYENICEIKTFITLEWSDMTDRVNEELKNGWVLLDIFPLGNGVRVLMGKLNKQVNDAYSEYIAGVEKRVQDGHQFFRGMTNPPIFNLDVDTKRMMELDNRHRAEAHEFNMSYGLVSSDNKETNDNTLSTDNNYSGPSGYKNLELLKLLDEELGKVGAFMSPRTILRVVKLSRLDEFKSTEELKLFATINNTLKALLRAKGREMYLHDTYNQLITYLESVVDE